MPEQARIGKSELVATTEIARRLGITPNRIRQLHASGKMPAPIGAIGNRTVWRWAEIRRWALKTGRLTE